MLAVVASAGCGEEPRLGASAAEELRRGVDEVRVAAAAGDREGALASLEALRARVDRAAGGGRLGGEDAAVLRRGITRARRRVEQEVAAPEPTPTATPEPTPAAPQEEDPGQGKGKGKGKGRGGGDADEGDD